MNDWINTNPNISNPESDYSLISDYGPQLIYLLRQK